MPFGPHLQGFFDTLPLDRKIGINARTAELQAEIEDQKKVLRCPVCDRENDYLMKFLGMDTPICWACVWSFIKLQRKVIVEVRQMRKNEELFYTMMDDLMAGKTRDYK